MINSHNKKMTEHQLRYLNHLKSVAEKLKSRRKIDSEEFTNSYNNFITEFDHND